MILRLGRGGDGNSFAGSGPWYGSGREIPLTNDCRPGHPGLFRAGGRVHATGLLEV